MKSAQKYLRGIFCRKQIVQRSPGKRIADAEKKGFHWQRQHDVRTITLRIREIAETRIRFGCPRIHIQ
ncbi:hypothetical protein DQY92_19430 [Salmonella enterica subsp. enterica serovar Javiana]|nr:hypothetical protein [Salmonella enterica subsp. enterica serovar Javiana]EBV2938463.1 hypothetical protein [Salmonella enterica subsp. enterica serovar Javiana]